MEVDTAPIIAEVIRLIGKRPFQPFSLIAHDGSRYLITASRQVAASDDRVVVMDDAKGICFFRAAQIASVEPVVDAA